MTSFSIKTPITGHVDFDSVYEPAEDSFLLLDALESELAEIRNSKPVMCVEIGSGSGVISAALAESIPTAVVVACDVNPEAALASRTTFSVNEVSAKSDVILLDFFQGWHALENRVDLLVCNPPYVATEEDEVGSRDLRASWAGGGSGRKLTDAVIRSLPKLLTQNGVAYIVVEQCNKPERLEAFAKSFDLCTKTVLKRKAGRELLSIMKLWKNRE